MSCEKGTPMSQDRAEAINPGPNNPVSEAEALREETVAERINPGDQGPDLTYPADKAERINPGQSKPTEAELLDEAEHRFSPGPQE